MNRVAQAEKNKELNRLQAQAIHYEQLVKGVNDLDFTEMKTKHRLTAMHNLNAWESKLSETNELIAKLGEEFRKGA